MLTHVLGYITAGRPNWRAGRLLASAVNSNVGAWKLAPAATEIEAQTIRWLAEFIGYPVDCGGIMVSG
jgi:glutamate/tyrosine decarboxylase-like PLP-dependent enzyme